VHADIAPVLANTLRSWLPEVTSGRYVDATVDPATCRSKSPAPVAVARRGPALDWTAEQIYLLLHVALANT